MPYVRRLLSQLARHTWLIEGCASDGERFQLRQFREGAVVQGNFQGIG